MTLDTFFKKFDQFAHAPGAVTKMRQLVLDLAVKGRLTERDLIKESVASKYSSEPSSDDLPANWRLLNFGKFCDIQGGNQPPKSQFSDKPKPGYVRMFQIRDLGEKPVPTYIPKDSTNRFCCEGEILIGRYGASVGKVFWAQNGAYNVALAKFIFPEDALLSGFAFRVLKSDFFQKEIAGASRSAQAGYNKGDLASIDFPLPPLAEQKRIVAKVDELMALCDRLEAQQQERDEQARALARASLARFAEAPTPANLNLLFHKSYSIPPADLRKAILALAVRGKLVPQDSKDEPASSILSATRSLFEQLVAAKKLSAPKPLPSIKNDKLSFALPSGWAWCRFGQLMRISSGDGLISKDMNDGPIPVYGGNGVTGYHDAHNVSKRTLVIGRVGFYCGSIHVTPEKAWITDNAFNTTFDEKHVDLEFLCWLLKATDLRARDNATAQPVISGGKVYPTILALPPLAEQRRIVTKVDQLMDLVDQLETQLAASRASAKNLLEAVVGELTSNVSISSANGASHDSLGQRPRKAPAKATKG